MKNSKWLYIKNGNVVEQVCKVGPAPLEPTRGGTEAYVSDFLHHVSGQKVLLLSCSNISESFDDGIVTAKCFDISGGRCDSSIVKTINIARAAFIATMMILKFKPNRILCGRLGFLLWISCIISKILRCPIVYSGHNALNCRRPTMLNRIQSRMNTFFIKKTKGAICHGPFLKDQLKKIGVAEDRIYEFDVRLDDFFLEVEASEDVDAGVKSRDKYILFVGRVEQNKGVFDLLNAFDKIDIPDLSLVYAGDGAALDGLKEAVAKENFRDRVFCLGKVPHEKLGKLMRNSFVVVTPTRSEFPEGRCMVAMEALVAGAPVIAPQFGPFPYLVNHLDNGLLYLPDDVDDLSQKIRMLASDIKLRESLIAGAIKKGKQLMIPPFSFFQAIHRAFSLKVR